MALHPEYQLLAQKEIDRVVGSERLPDYGDKEKLPFVNALLAETLRWNPVTPLALDHRALYDDKYQGYRIPAGAKVVGNAWAALHDESLYGPDPLDFNPNRFIRQDGQQPPSPELIAFGFGLRICPGRYLALNTAYLTMAHLLSTFTIAKAVDNEGNEVQPRVEYSPTLISHPLPFQCRFIPRRP
ncbi:hypothetical protein PQX77_008405 [Marasmius sp. AFHP31]|nr:hypothetical protein PQX77_013018 [Marasmius sp. AFHP31]KAK1228540.1 hypothetical protein PQX77_008405 [Marasmius sp. AFHP31]